MLRLRRVPFLLPLLAALACQDPVPVYQEGPTDAWLCPDAARLMGLTVLDLSSEWTPAVLAPGPDGTAPTYRATYLALAQGRLADASDDGLMARADGGLEVFGFAPTFDAIAARLADDRRHRCHDAIDDAPLAALTGEPREEYKGPATARVKAAARLRATLERERARRRLPDLAALAAADRRRAPRIARLDALERHVAGVRAAQAHLACDGLLPARAVDGRFTWQTAIGLLAVQRREQLVPRGHLDAETRALLAGDSRALDHRAALRALRERVVAATGLLEDGSAGAGNAPVLGQQLASPAFGRVAGHAPLPDAAPDLVARATEAAALALGWTDPDATARSLASLPPRVAVRLPPPPAYHAAHMELAVEIDRGDLWYDPRPRTRRPERRPALVVYALDGDRRVPLVRWPTTIGGWKKTKVGRHRERDEWMESPVGPRIWREMFVAPAWLPPDTTPDRELVRSIGRRHTLRRDLAGPSYRSAYGLLMLVHRKVVTTRRGERQLDERVRTHGSGSVASIFDGTSHGCHRLPPVLALRLGGFLLAHRDHVRAGETATAYVRKVRYRGLFPLRITTRGYRIELTPPIPVEVLPGRVRSARKTPPGQASTPERRGVAELSFAASGRGERRAGAVEPSAMGDCLDLDRVAPTVRPAGRNAGTQRWRELLFVHWSFEAEAVRALVPRSLELDLWGGRAWVGLVPFRMEATRTWWMPRALGMSFLETNLRTYVHHRGKPGVYFFSLEASSWLAVKAARWTWSLPYFHAAMSARRDGDRVAYRSQRKRAAATKLDVTYDVGAPLGPSEVGSLQFFLLERYHLFVERRGAVRRGQVHHTPYPARAASIVSLEQGLTAAAGLPAGGRLETVHYSDGVEVEVFGPFRER